VSNPFYYQLCVWRGKDFKQALKLRDVNGVPFDYSADTLTLTVKEGELVLFQLTSVADSNGQITADAAGVVTMILTRVASAAFKSNRYTFTVDITHSGESEIYPLFEGELFVMR
jgi:hypothetical protein